MAVSLLSRPAESRAVAEFLDAASADPSALVIEGEPGIGKTTMWTAAVESAARRGFRVLSARPASAESVMAYAALADMIDGVETGAWPDLPSPQRLALNRMLLRSDTEGAATDPRALAAGFVSIVKASAAVAPVLLAIDDLQWLDSSSMQALAFALRRLSGRVGMLGTVRTDSCDISWLQVSSVAGIRRITLGPLSLGGLRQVVSERLGRTLSRRTMVQIYEISRGNPFYALELARVMDDRTPTSQVPLPRTLAELVRARTGNLDREIQDLLLAVSCVAAATVELVARATDTDVRRVIDLLGEAEDKGIVEINGHRLHFTHPLLAKGIYDEATPTRRRAMHRCLAEIVEEPELQARHLALSTAWGDPHTLECLDGAAEIADGRGAPAAAAELLELAIALGGDGALRRITLAYYHFSAGNVGRARVLLEELVDNLEPGALCAQALSLLGIVRITDDSFVEGAALFERALSEAADDLALRLPTMVVSTLALLYIGQPVAALRRVEDAVMDATRLGEPLLLSQALGVRVMLECLRGDGVDEATMRSALEMQPNHPDLAMRMGFQVVASLNAQNAMLLGWTGQLERARQEMATLRRRCAEHGLEQELIYFTYYSLQIEIWRGAFAEATLLAEDIRELALRLGGNVNIGAEQTVRAVLAAYAGDEHGARCAASEALPPLERCGAQWLAAWPIAVVGFLEVSLGNYEAALATLAPLLSRIDATAEGTEIVVAEFVPDAVEALVHLGRLDDAEILTDRLETNGRRLDRAWMLAVGARCRSMLLAAQGKVDSAIDAAETAMVEHDRLPMPFDRARSQLLLGQLQRRQGRRNAAATTLRQALDAFERMGTPLWADRARAELARAEVTPGPAKRLTVSEHRVAELAASGMTNRDIAAALFISPKTVEANLARIYRKLDIHSRAELGVHMGQSGNGETRRMDTVHR